MGGLPNGGEGDLARQHRGHRAAWGYLVSSPVPATERGCRGSPIRGDRRGVGRLSAGARLESDADTLEAIIQEMLLAKTSERQGRLIDSDVGASMEKKKQEGYF